MAGSSLVRSVFFSACLVPSFSPKLRVGISAFDLRRSSSTTYVFTLPRETEIYLIREEAGDLSGKGGRKERGEREYGDFLPSWETNAASSIPNRGKGRKRELITLANEDLLLRVLDGIARIHLPSVSMSISSRTPESPKDIRMWMEFPMSGGGKVRKSFVFIICRI